VRANNPDSAFGSADDLTPTKRRARRPVVRLALRPEEAAEALGVGRSFFYEQVLPEVRVVYRGRVRLVAVAELERWLEREGTRWT
jgi:excisionase family DNA binding protein